jgi:hypothetical protein
MPKKPMPLIPLEQIAAWLATVDVLTVAKETKLGFATLYNIRRGKPNCNYRTVVVLSQYMGERRVNGRKAVG